MSHSTLIILGATILSLILIAGIIDYTALAQEEEEDEKEEEEESSKDEKEEEESEESKEEESEQEESSNNDSSDSNEETSSSEEQKEEETTTDNETPVPNTTAIPEIMPEPIVNLTGDHILNPEPVAEGVTTTTTEPITVQKQFNATCKCMTTTTPSSSTSTPEPTTTPPTNNNPNGQIPLTKTDIIDSKSFGEVIDPAYTNYYTVPNLLDNVINDISFWSQAGKSSFYIKLDNALDNYQVCSAELNIHNPKGTPYLMDVGVSQNYTGVLDQTSEKIQFEKCVKNMDEIFMIFDNAPNSFVSIGEIKLFGSKLGTEVTQQPPSQPTNPIINPPTLLQPTENATKINIQDSTAEIDIKNSTVTFKFDPLTASFVGTNQ